MIEKAWQCGSHLSREGIGAHGGTIWDHQAWGSLYLQPCCLQHAVLIMCRFHSEKSHVPRISKILGVPYNQASLYGIVYSSFRVPCRGSDPATHGLISRAFFLEHWFTTLLLVIACKIGTKWILPSFAASPGHGCYSFQMPTQMNRGKHFCCLSKVP